MSIQSYTFAGFLFAVIFLYRLLPDRAVVVKRLALLLANLSFYTLFGIRSLLCVLLFAAITWLGGRFKKKGVYPAIFLLLALWITQKGNGWYLLGISFYALQSIGYLLDVKEKKIPAEKNFFSLLLALSFFPISLQGPICRYSELRDELNRQLTIDTARTAKPTDDTAGTAKPTSDTAGTAKPTSDTAGTARTTGDAARSARTTVDVSETARVPLSDPDALPRIFFGFFKKLVIADRIALLTAPLFQNPDSATGPYVLLALLAYTVQLYADFTGGIDIALGTAKCLGFTLPENFQNPFAARSLADYWRRWHITLGTWFRDYVFYPLSFNPFWDRFHLTPKKILYLSTLFTWCLTGLWHGLSLRFLLWGLANAVLLLLEQVSFSQTANNRARSRLLPDILTMAGVFLTTSLLRAFDCYPTAGTALTQLGSILSPTAWSAALTGGILADSATSGASLLSGLTLPDLTVLLAALPFSFLIGRLRKSKGRWQNQLAVSLLLLVTLLFGIYGRGYDAAGFIYGNFV